MSAARSAAKRIRDFVVAGGTGDDGLDHDLMVVTGEVLAPSFDPMNAALKALQASWVAEAKEHAMQCDHADSWFRQIVCPEACGSVHPRCNACGETLGHCRRENGDAS